MAIRRRLVRLWENYLFQTLPPHASSPPPAMGSPSAEQERFRKEAYSTPQSLFAPSRYTARTYEATLRAIAPR